MPNGFLFSFSLFFFFLPITAGSQSGWWHAFRPMFLYHCMRPPVLKSFPVTGWRFATWDRMIRLVTSHPSVSSGFGSGSWLLCFWSGKHIVNRKYLSARQRRLRARAWEERPDLCESCPVLSPQGRSNSCLLRVWTQWNSAQFWQEASCPRSGTVETCFPEITCSCKLINTFFSFFSKFRMTVWRVSGVIHLAGRSSLYPYNVYLFTLTFLLDWMHFIIKDLEIYKSTKVKIYTCPGLRRFKNGHFLYYT